MSRVIQCFKMLQELSTHQILNQRQLAELLETNPRNIREYRKELCLAGIPVEEKRGRNGGYFLPASYRFGRLQPETGELSYLAELEEAIAKHKKVQIQYQSLSHNQPITLKIDPIAILSCEKQLYLVAFSHLKNDFELFYLSQDSIQSMKVLNETFHMSRGFSLEDFVATAPIFHGRVKKYRVRLDPIQESFFLKEKWGDHIRRDGKDDLCTYYSFYSDQEEKLIGKALIHQIEFVEPVETLDRIEDTIRRLNGLYLEKQR